MKESIPPIVSIIIPVFNAQQYLAQCLISVQAQTYNNLEIICVNDGSTDASLEILNKRAEGDKRIRIINQQNQGLSSARNTGLKYAKGDWIMFVDSDDWLEENAVETAINIAYENKCVIVAFDYICEFAHHSEVRQFLPTKKIFNGEDFFLRLLGPIGEQLNEPNKLNSLSIACAKLYKASTISNCKFISLKEIGPSEDTLFNLSIAKTASSIVYWPYAGYHYRKTNSVSTTQSYIPNLINKWEKLYDKIELLVENDHETVALNNRIACGLISAGINEMRSDLSIIEKYRWVKWVLSLDRYKTAFSKLDINPIHSIRWRIFFHCAKNNYFLLVTILLYIIEKILHMKTR